MTVAAETVKHVYPANGVTREWPYTFALLEDGHLLVYVTAPDGAPALLDRGMYDLDRARQTVTYPKAAYGPLGDGYKVTLLRQMPLIQETDLENQGPFFAKTLEDTFDYGRMIDQQLAEQMKRALLAPVDQEDGADAYAYFGEIVGQAGAIRDEAAALRDQTKGYLDAALASAGAVDELLETSMPGGFNRFWVDNDQMQLIMAYYGESTSDDLYIEDGALILRLADGDKTIGRITFYGRGEWQPDTAYEWLDMVTHDGTAYFVSRYEGAPIGASVDDAAYWAALAHGGQAATIAVESVVMLEPDAGAYFTNVGTANEAVYIVGIPRGQSGETGATFTPAVSAAGVISWANDKGLSNPAARSIKGGEGEAGATFMPAVSAAGVISWTNDKGLSNPAPQSIAGKEGEMGPPFTLGADFATEAALAAALPAGDSYGHMVQNDLYTWNGAAWVNRGPIIGVEGATFTPSVTDDGTLSWTNDRGLSNPAAVNVKGVTFTPIVSAAGVISWTNDKGLANPAARSIRGGDGETGATFTPVVSAAGVLSWSNDKGLSNPAAQSIAGRSITGVALGANMELMITMEG